MDIPLNRPDITDKEITAVVDVLESRNLKGDGKYDERCAKLVESEFGTPRALMTPSCTHALEMAALLLDIDDGDEVLMPSYTFPSTATAFMLRGAEPVFCDVRPETLNIDPKDVAEKITPKTAAIVPVHYAGVASEMDQIINIAADHDIPVVEDAAQGVNATYQGEALGTIGDLGCYSFHGTKSYIAGEGGTLLINDETLIERAEQIRQKGTNYPAFKRGETEYYEWVDVGSSYIPSEMQAAVASVQLSRRNEIRNARRETYRALEDGLEDLAADGCLELPTIPDSRQTNYHIFYILVDRQKRDELVEHLNADGIGAASHYRPLHTSKMGRTFGYEPGDLPITESVAKRVVRLPVHPGVDEADRWKIIRSVRGFIEAQ